MKTELKVGDLVIVSGPYIGGGKVGRDAITGCLMRIVKLCPAKSFYLPAFGPQHVPASAELVDPGSDVVDYMFGDPTWNVPLSRLEVRP